MGIEWKLQKTFGDPENDLNDLEKNVAYDFQLDGPLKIPNQQ